MMRSAVIRILLVATTASVMPSCNKDGVIEDEDRLDHYRPATAVSSARCNRVYEWTPAPGQFINDAATGGMTEPIETPAAAAEWAERRLDAGLFVSLGGFGGYIVVGFDHSVLVSEHDYDFAVAGNAFLNSSSGSGGSNEPGIVYVMQDSNGNGLPDDVWFELRGSDSFSSETIRNYEVTYYRPSAPGMNVEWIDNVGNKGSVDYLESFHKQDYYYPAWVTADFYTLKGVCLPARNSQDQTTGFWNNSAFGWGYADNMGSDNVKMDKYPQCNRFRGSDAITSDGKPAGLHHIDFVRIQTGVNAKSGLIGEVSTEVCGVFDLNI